MAMEGVAIAGAWDSVNKTILALGWGLLAAGMMPRAINRLSTKARFQLLYWGVVVAVILPMLLDGLWRLLVRIYG